MGRPPSTGGPAFRFNVAEVMEMEAVLQDHNNMMPAQEVLVAIANKFSNSPERQGKFVVQTKQIWNWFQNKRYAVRAKGFKGSTKLTVSSMQLLPTRAPVHSAPMVSTTPVVKGTTAVPVAQSAPVISGEDNLSSSRMSQSVADSPGLVVSADNIPMEFEARSARDGAWYDVAAFLSLRNLEAGCPEVLVRFAGFGPEEDEWINVTTHVRHRSLPCESSECVAVLPGDLILCFQEGKEQALYFDAHVLDAQRRRHDARGCRCRFLVRYDHDLSEEIVPLRKICRRPETDYRLQRLHAMNESSAEQRKSAPSGGTPAKEQHKSVAAVEQIKTDVNSPFSNAGISSSVTPSVHKPLVPLDPSSTHEEQESSTHEEQEGATYTSKTTGDSNAAPTTTQLPYPVVINLDPKTEVENNPHEVKISTDDMAVINLDPKTEVENNPHEVKISTDDMAVDKPPEKHTDVLPTRGIDATSTHNMTEEVINEASLPVGLENVYKPEQVNPEPMIVETSNTTDEGNANIEHGKHALASSFDTYHAREASLRDGAGVNNVEGGGPELISSIGNMTLELEISEGKTAVDLGNVTPTIDTADHPVNVPGPIDSSTSNANVEGSSKKDDPAEKGIELILSPTA